MSETTQLQTFSKMDDEKHSLCRADKFHHMKFFHCGNLPHFRENYFGICALVGFAFIFTTIINYNISSYNVCLSVVYILGKISEHQILAKMKTYPNPYRISAGSLVLSLPPPFARYLHTFRRERLMVAIVVTLLVFFSLYVLQLNKIFHSSILPLTAFSLVFQSRATQVTRHFRSGSPCLASLCCALQSIHQTCSSLSSISLSRPLSSHPTHPRPYPAPLSSLSHSLLTLSISSCCVLWMPYGGYVSRPL